ncbi:YetF domain-containing protein [Roseibacillus persicicus]
MFVEEPTIDLFVRGFALTALGMLWVVVLVRINGLRSFSKMTNFDFVMTVAVGSLLAGASQSTSWESFGQICAAMTGLFLVQYTTARLRQASDRFENLMQNEPVILMRDGQIIEEALSRTRVARSDLFAKLREANVLNLSKVRAVVLETTGDISVLHGDECAENLLSGTKRIDQ